MLSNYRRRSRAMVRAAGTPMLGYGAARTARTLVNAAKKLAPFARAAGAKSTFQRKLGGFVVPRRKVTTAKRGGISESAPGNDWSVARKVVIGRAKKPSVANLKKIMEVGMNKITYRYQALTNFDTTVGFHPLANFKNTTSGALDMPLHIYDLTSFPNVSQPAPGYSYSWDSELATAQAVRSALGGQPPGGGTVSVMWHKENGTSSDATYPNSRVFRHDWTSISANLYGARKRSNKFMIMFFRCKDEFANPIAAGISNPAYSELIEYLQRPLIYSNLQTYNKDPAKKLQIVKQMTYWVPAAQTTDVDTAVGKIKEIKIFLRHDKVYGLDWRHEGTAGSLPHAVVDGLDYVQDLTHHNYPTHGSRLFMCIRAFAPERRTAASYVPVADIDPSYDILIRNQVSLPY